MAIIFIVLLSDLTSRISTRKKEQELLEDAQKVIMELGEKGFLDLLGIPTEELRYDQAPLYPGPDRGAWTYSDEELINMSVYEKCAPSVVQILSDSSLSDDAQGSGVIISSEGHILTNLHVLSDNNTYTVNFYDGSTAKAHLIGKDRLTDLAVLVVEGARELSPITSAKDLPVVGEKILAIGNPFGFTWSLTTGIVSGLDRTVYNSDGGLIANMIQTDAMINPGNSGGPLLNSRGEMIGLVSSIYSTSGSAQGISFSLPVSVCSLVANEIIKNGKYSRGWLDILSLELNPQIVDYCSLPVEKGILVSQTVPDGFAAKGGIKGGTEKAQYGQSVIYLGGDVIIDIDGRPIESYADYFAAFFETKAGDTVDVTVQRGNSKVLLKDIQLVEQTSENVRWVLR